MDAPSVSRALIFLGRLITEGAAPDLLPTVREVFGPIGGAAGLAARHHALFGMEAPPYQSFFLSPDRLLGGDTSAAVAAEYARAGFAPDVSDTAPDHLGIELVFVGVLVRRGASDAERGFLDGHLLRWLPALAAALPAALTAGDQSSGESPSVGLFNEAVCLALELTRSRRASLGGAVPDWALPPTPAVADGSLREIAELLCTPALAGGLLGRRAIGAMGREHGAPRGFGPRAQELKTLLLSSARYGVLDDVLGEIDSELCRWMAAHRAGSPRGPNDSRPWTHARPWLERITATRSLIAAMRKAA